MFHIVPQRIFHVIFTTNAYACRFLSLNHFEISLCYMRTSLFRNHFQCSWRIICRIFLFWIHDIKKGEDAIYLQYKFTS